MMKLSPTPEKKKRAPRSKKVKPSNEPDEQEANLTHQTEEFRWVGAGNQRVSISS